MDIKKYLLEYGKKTIFLDDLSIIIKINKNDTKELFEFIVSLVEKT